MLQLCQIALSSLGVVGRGRGGSELVEENCDN